MSKLVRESISLINEEKVGEFITRIRGEESYVEIFRNPRSIKRLEPDIRGITLKNGDFFVFNTPMVIHEVIINYLKNLGYAPKSAGFDEDQNTFVDVVAWTRDGHSNKFGLSESYVSTEFMSSIEQDFIQTSIKNAEEKNPSVNFVFEIITNM